MCEKKYMLASVYVNLYTAFSWGFHLDLVSNSGHLNLLLTWQLQRMLLLVIPHYSYLCDLKLLTPHAQSNCLNSVCQKVLK